MTITRTVNGTEIKISLTENELYAAYAEQQKLFDEADVKDVFNAFDDDELVDCYGMTLDQITEKIPDIVTELRRNIDKYGMSFQAARDAAIAEVL